MRVEQKKMLVKELLTAKQLIIKSSNIQTNSVSISPESHFKIRFFKNNRLFAPHFR